MHTLVSEALWYCTQSFTIQLLYPRSLVLVLELCLKCTNSHTETSASESASSFRTANNTDWYLHPALAFCISVLITSLFLQDKWLHLWVHWYHFLCQELTTKAVTSILQRNEEKDGQQSNQVYMYRNISVSLLWLQPDQGQTGERENKQE